MRNRKCVKRWILRSSLLSAAACLSLFATAANAELLYGKAEHLETLPPLEQRLQVGEVFYKRLLKQYGITDGWNKIPRGFAGLWECGDGAKVMTDLLTGTQTNRPGDPTYKKVVLMGHQVDGNGQIWDFPAARSVQVGTTSKLLIYDLVRSRELLEMTESTCTARVLAIQLKVRKDTNRIVEVIQGEHFSVSILVAPGQTRNACSAKLFTASGRPWKLQEWQTEGRLLKAFEPVDFLNGIDLKECFANYREGTLSSVETARNE